MDAKQQSLIRAIQAARSQYHLSEAALAAAPDPIEAEEAESKVMQWLRYCDTLQRRFFKLYGRFVPHSDGYVYLYDTQMNYWTRWKSATAS